MCGSASHGRSFFFPPKSDKLATTKQSHICPIRCFPDSTPSASETPHSSPPRRWNADRSGEERRLSRYSGTCPTRGYIRQHVNRWRQVKALSDFDKLTCDGQITGSEQLQNGRSCPSAARSGPSYRTRSKQTGS